MSRGAEPEGCRLPCAKLWADHCHGGRMVVVQRAPAIDLGSGEKKGVQQRDLH